jgi:glycine/D-amino acid oxidase-like deaminating enzyme
MSEAIPRRDFLKLTGGVAAAQGVRAPARRLVVAPARQFARVQVSPKRVIRTVVGLRPFRASGFVVNATKLDAKTVVHNYGHGGGGLALSWGTSHLATELALETGETRFAVLGCGAVGLATARLLQRRGADVTIYAKDLPPHTTSNVAGGHWSAAQTYIGEHRTPAFADQFQRAARFSHREFQDLLGDYYGVRWIDNYVVHAVPPASRRPEGAGQNIPDLFPDEQEVGPKEHPFGAAAYVRRYGSMLIEPATYLAAVMRDFLLFGGKLVVREFADASAVVALPEAVVVNCTGLGAKALFGDEELVPIKGQLTFLLPQPEVDYIALFGPLYMFPRRDGILLGATYERGVTTLDPDVREMRRILDEQKQFFDGMT